MEANKGLINCYKKVSVDEYKKLPEATQASLCENHKNRIKEILDSNEMTMTRLV